MRTEKYNLEQVFGEGRYGHSLSVVEKDINEIYVAPHTFDSYTRRLSSDQYEKMRMLHIEGVRKW